MHKSDFPKEQLDLLILELARGGFFDDQKRPEDRTHLSVRIDRGKAAKAWTAEPRLDDFIDRVFHEGQELPAYSKRPFN